MFFALVPVCIVYLVGSRMFLFSIIIDENVLFPVTKVERLVHFLVKRRRSPVKHMLRKHMPSFGISPFNFISLLSSAILELFYFLMSTR